MMMDIIAEVFRSLQRYLDSFECVLRSVSLTKNASIYSMPEVTLFVNF